MCRIFVMLSTILCLADWNPALAQSGNSNCVYRGKSYAPFSASICMNGYMARCVGNGGEMQANGGWIISQYMQCTEPTGQSRKYHTDPNAPLPPVRPLWTPP